MRDRAGMSLGPQWRLSPVSVMGHRALTPLLRTKSSFFQLESHHAAHRFPRASRVKYHKLSGLNNSEKFAFSQTWGLEV